MFLCRNPTPGKTDLLNVEWAPSTLDKPCYLEIGDNLTMKDGPMLSERMLFWDDASKTHLQDAIYDMK